MESDVLEPIIHQQVSLMLQPIASMLTSFQARYKSYLHSSVQGVKGVSQSIGYHPSYSTYTEENSRSGSLAYKAEWSVVTCSEVVVDVVVSICFLHRSPLLSSESVGVSFDSLEE